MTKVASSSIVKGGKIFFCGNGGSAADAQHLTAELLVRFKKKNIRKGIPAMALSLDISTLTACANDFSFDKIYERPLEALGNDKDILLALSTTGNSVNVVNAIKKARKMGIKVFGFLGSDGGRAIKFCNECFLVPSDVTGHIQEMHITAGHALIESIEDDLYKIGYFKKLKK